MRAALGLLLALAACAASDDQDALQDATFLGNAECPMGQRPIDPAFYFEHEGQRVFFCNPDCAEKGAADPETWLARVYGTPQPVGNATCPVSGEPVGPDRVSWQAYAVGVCCPDCIPAFAQDGERLTRAALAER